MNSIETIGYPDGFKGERSVNIPAYIREKMLHNDITRQLHVTNIGYYPDAKGHFRERDNGADENILIYCAKGKGWIECEHEIFPISSNEAFIIPKGKRHSYGADIRTPWSIYWIHFKGKNVKMFDSIMNKRLDITDSFNSRYEDRVVLFEDMFQNLDKSYDLDVLEYSTFSLMYFLASIKYLPQFREVKSVKNEDAIHRSIQYMKDNVGSKLSLKDIADAVGYSSSRLSALFVSRMCVSPMTYYNQLKIQKACAMLVHSNINIKEIAFELNYYDPFHFSHSFSKEMGLSPKKYRILSRSVRE